MFKAFGQSEPLAESVFDSRCCPFPFSKLMVMLSQAWMEGLVVDQRWK